MPQRLHFRHLFRGNPLADTTPEEAFSLLNWGNAAKRAYPIDAPEPLIMLGMAKMLKLENLELHFRRGESFLAVGHKSNELYIIPRVNNAPRTKIAPWSPHLCRNVGQVSQTDYWSTKGKAKVENHYYHEHEKPYPWLWLHDATGVGYLRAANNGGSPSYAVGKEGIVG